MQMFAFKQIEDDIMVLQRWVALDVPRKIKRYYIITMAAIMMVYVCWQMALVAFGGIACIAIVNTFKSKCFSKVEDQS